MIHGHLSEFFTGFAAKELSAVEADTRVSHQHEFNGVAALRELLGSERRQFPAHLIYLTDEDDEPVEADAPLTWYDAREDHPTRTEWRLYFPTTAVSECAAPGDLIVIGRRPDDSLLVVIAEAGSTVANQVLWLFGLGAANLRRFSVRAELDTNQDRLDYPSRVILDNLGVIAEPIDESFLDQMLASFDGTFPPTREFSAYARSTLDDIEPLSDPDGAILAWMEREEVLFRTLEKHDVLDRLNVGFADDVDGFLSYSLSVQNRRKSRAGRALENHLESVLDAHNIRYQRNAITENRSKPDFLFPSATHYHDPKTNPDLLTALGVKSTCKDRWRQVLAEADRIGTKHLLTLEAGISVNQTAEMASKRLQLVLPSALHSTFLPSQRPALMTVSGFVEMVRRRQGVLGA